MVDKSKARAALAAWNRALREADRAALVAEDCQSDASEIYDAYLDADRALEAMAEAWALAGLPEPVETAATGWGE